MKISITRGRQAEIAGRLAELCELQRQIFALAASNEIEVMIAADQSTNPFPWDERLDGLVIRAARGKIKVFATQESLVIAGDPTHLEALASYFEFAVDEEFGAHHHLEFYPEHCVLSEDALSLVIRVEAAELDPLVASPPQSPPGSPRGCPASDSEPVPFRAGV